MGRSPYDDFIDGLRVDEDTTYIRRTHRYPRPPPGLGETPRFDKEAIIASPRHAKRAKLAAVIGASLVAGMCIGGTFAGPSITTVETVLGPAPSDQTVTQPWITPAVIHTETVTAVPASCSEAVAAAMELFEHAAAIASANGQQLDIMSEAHIAMYRQDWARLVELADQQRTLQGELSKHTAPFGLGYQAIMDGLATCQSAR